MQRKSTNQTWKTQNQNIPWGEWKQKGAGAGTWAGTWAGTETAADRGNERTRSAGKTQAVSKFRGSILQGPILRRQQRQGPSERPAGCVSLLLNGTLYHSEHFLVVSPDVLAPTHTSLFLQPRSAKVTRRVKFDCQICLSSGIHDFLFNPSAFGGRGEAAQVCLRLRGPWRGKPFIEPTVMLTILLLLAS